ncbi:MAG: cob(I)yrinic acid a,c-diamide adenosyltransferase [Flavobacteriaceae bacterium]|jgi:cob(I)alamin adenosyltransferase|nr:cob(I)yrinic acid a,c-diamide adenosyltransferase [Flavobacteriaceae bacterium]
MKIYTKTGDQGTTALYGGTRVPKNHVRIEAYGTVDELNSFVGLIRSYNAFSMIDYQLQIIQNSLFDLGAELATPTEKLVLANGKKRLACTVSEKEIELLESWIDVMNDKIPELNTFILPTGNINVSNSHVSRAVCRRAERKVLELNDEEKVREICHKYLNRLSDYLFVLARFFGHLANEKETIWRPNEQE